VKGNCKIGELFLIDKVFDENLKIDYDIKIESGTNLLKNHVTTVFEPIVNSEQERRGLVDMEAHGICTVLSNFNYLNKLTIIKIVSDFMDLDAKYLSSKHIQKLIKINLLDIDNFLNDNRKLCN